MNVIPTSCWRALSSSCISLRSFRSSAPSGSSRSRTVGPVDEGPGERDALLLAARHLPRPPLAVAAEPDELERLGDPPLLVGLRDLLLAEAVADVLGDVHVREQGVVLEDRVDVAPVRRDAGDRLAGEQDLALRRLLEARDHPEGRRLAAAGRAQQAGEGPRRDLEVHPVDRDDGAEALRDLDQLDVRDGGRHRARRRRREAAAGLALMPPGWAGAGVAGSTTVAGTFTRPHVGGARVWQRSTRVVAALQGGPMVSAALRRSQRALRTRFESQGASGEAVRRSD